MSNNQKTLSEHLQDMQTLRDRLADPDADLRAAVIALLDERIDELGSKISQC